MANVSDEQTFNTSDYELCHYGVLGMKWGIRKARKQGVAYAYKSRQQKRYEQKLTKQKAKGASAKRLAKTKDMLDMYKQRDKMRVDYAKRTSVGKAIAQNILLSPIGASYYADMRAAGKSRISSLAIVSSIGSTLNAPVKSHYDRAVARGRAEHIENAAAKKDLKRQRDEKRK